MIAQEQRLIQIMGDEDDGLAQPRLKFLQLQLHVMPDQRIEGRERLVHQQNLGIGGQRPGQTHALLHAARKLGGIAVLEPGKPHQRDLFARAAMRLKPRHAVECKAIGHILDHRAVRQQGKALEHHGHLAAAERLQARGIEAEDILAVEQDAPAGRFDQAVEMADQGAFARSGQAHDDEGFARPDIERDVMQAKDMVRLVLQAGLVHACMDLGQRALGIAAKDLGHAIDPDLHRTHHFPSRCRLACTRRP